ncbi:MAG: tRNA glutamyl-Q(34) synthetase GluQRS [Alphaproteobacteria bacterium]|nr:tRNA glutamyl-Q(34) synthetase GluQRS [Alphaproteobacteria bacterium]MBV9862125.1 tRNA glutamyl-Q(34) synthetase GluQRS [Alphaproteobacteria bacterium]
MNLPIAAPEFAAEIVTRFAPSPTGYLHLGHVRSALAGWQAARMAAGRFLLRLEDIDQGRCRDIYARAIVEDLAWLGLNWDGAVRRQSQHLDDYRHALARLEMLGVLYPCFCTRRTIRAEIAAAGGAPHDLPVPYPGICRRRSGDERAMKIAAGADFAVRLDLARARALTGPVYWIEQDETGSRRVEATPEALGDVVLARKDAPASYHLAVTVDDALQAVTLVTRGVDLFAATHIHRVLQALLGLPVPHYRHHALLTDAAGRRLSKRDGAVTVRAMRAAGASPQQILAAAQSSGR